LWLLGDMVPTELEPSVISCNAGISACERCGQWSY